MLRRIESILGKIPFASFEGAVILVGVLFALVEILAPMPTIKNPSFAPSAVAGFATMSGILAAFTGFWLIQLYNDSSVQLKKWLTKRVGVIVLVVGLGLSIVGGSLSQLVYESADLAVRQASAGAVLILLADLEVVFMTLYKSFCKPNWGTQ